MKNTLIFLGILFVTSVVHAQWHYPATKMADSVDHYFGKTVTDQYRWMEHTEDSSVLDWFTQQSKYSQDILKNISGRDSLFKNFVALDKLQSTSYQNMVLVDSIWFYKKRLAGEPVASLYYRKSKQGNEVLLFNPMNFRPGHTFNIKNFTPSLHGTNITIETAEGGGEVATIRIMNVATKEFYKDSLAPTLYGVNAWVNDHAFIYTAHTSYKEDAIEFHLNTKAMLHVIGADRAGDTEILSAAKYSQLHIAPEDICFVTLDNEEKYLIGYLATAANELRTYYAPLTTIQDKIIPWKALFKKEDKITNFFTHGRDLYMLTYQGAPNYKITKTSIETPDIHNAITVYKEGKNKISDISGTKNYLLVTLTDGINNTVVQYDFKTAAFENIVKDLTGQVSVAFAGPKTDSSIIGVTSWNSPYTLYDFNAKTDQYRKSIFDETVHYPGVENMKVKEVEVSSYDGTMVPLSILYNKNTVPGGNNSCILTGYGCYGYSYSPYFSVMNLALVNQGVVLAIAHVRGGGEKGENWHAGGYKTTKPNTWKDFIACAEYLIGSGYATKERLAGTGTSAGGILIGRAITERPDLFAAAVCNVGDANALRAEFETNGAANSKEYGTVTDSAECMALIEMDALSHVKKGVRYPAVLCATGMNDARVAPWQPGKFAGALQNASASDKPVLLRVDLNNGHFTENRLVTYNDFADQYAFLLWQTGDPDFRLKK